ncbi:MAG: hypothetical protein A2X04_11050 [Bacteroidetes bacterium GWF2_41_9]|nr:MAG: hypothetical protein A2X06_11940 [Bacteroidetes bacterium GWC2_40_22]OFY57756.1 MAG: hypothetical protein A2X04_11050 [Bacteroidetes bacterium GWF2_41_9]HBH83717.1 hypothetical protein [Bacteroidales bacterium]HCU20792.1 hypothetical protein [Bacteroidales bacterium]
MKRKFNMKRKVYRITQISVIFIILNIGLFTGCNNKGSDNIETNKVYTELTGNITSEKGEEYAVEAPPFSDGIFPCTECHADMESNPVRRELVDMHDDISQIFNHDSENRWCLDCHDLNNRDSLRLASGKLLDFKESYKLCGQCHGEKYRDWKVGVHGKRTGEWNGKKEYLLCVHCHNPHSPKFRELTPDPPPIKQEEIK